MSFMSIDLYLRYFMDIKSFYGWRSTIKMEFGHDAIYNIFSTKYCPTIYFQNAAKQDMLDKSLIQLLSNYRLYELETEV